jgi:hypothetical protein
VALVNWQLALWVRTGEAWMDAEGRYGCVEQPV